MPNDNLLPVPRVRRQAQHLKLPFTAEMILNAETGQLIGIMVTSDNPEAAQALDRLMSGDYHGMQYCEPVTFRPAQYTGSDEHGQVWLQRENAPASTELVRREENPRTTPGQVFNPNGYFMDR